MASNGWEIKPAGVVALIILAGLLIYFIVQRLQNPSDKTPNNPIS
jgi:hypothetical protein